MGDAEKLGKFLELNPEIPRSIARVDDSMDFVLYEACGFGKFTDATTKPKLQSPNFSFGDWFKYLTNVAKLAPIREGERGVVVDRGVGGAEVGAGVVGNGEPELGVGGHRGGGGGFLRCSRPCL